MTREEQVRRNLELARGFFGHLLDHPDALEDIPSGTHVVLVPEDDPELADANLEVARTLVTRCPKCGSATRPVMYEGKETGGGVFLQPVCS